MVGDAVASLKMLIKTPPQSATRNHLTSVLPRPRSEVANSVIRPHEPQRRGRRGKSSSVIDSIGFWAGERRAIGTSPESIVANSPTLGKSLILPLREVREPSDRFWRPSLEGKTILSSPLCSQRKHRLLAPSFSSFGEPHV
jgi:hypothetical protein